MGKIYYYVKIRQKVNGFVNLSRLLRNIRKHDERKVKLSNIIVLPVMTQ